MVNIKFFNFFYRFCYRFTTIKIQFTIIYKIIAEKNLLSTNFHIIIPWFLLKSWIYFSANLYQSSLGPAVSHVHVANGSRYESFIYLDNLSLISSDDKFGFLS